MDEVVGQLQEDPQVQVEMKFQGRRVINHNQGTLWQLLLDPRVLRHCFPGCEVMEPTSETTFRIEFRLGYGLLRGRFRGTVSLTDLNPSQSLRMVIDARGKTGAFSGENVLRLTPVGDGQSTEVHFEGSGQVTGGIAALGAKIFDGAARDFSDHFFDTLASL